MGVAKNGVIQISILILILLSNISSAEEFSSKSEKLTDEMKGSAFNSTERGASGADQSQFRLDKPIENTWDLLMAVMNNKDLQQAYQSFSLSVGALTDCADYTDDKTTENIFKSAYSTTFWHDVIDNWFTGLKVDSFFDYSDLCYEYMSDGIDYFNSFYKQITGATTCDYDKDWPCMMMLFTEWLAEPIGQSIYNCWLFQYYGKIQKRAKLNTFVDTIDLYTSLLFNLMAESLQIRNYALLMQQYSADKQCADFQFSLANIIRIVFDFDSAESSGLNVKIRENAKTSPTVIDSILAEETQNTNPLVALAAYGFKAIKQKASNFLDVKPLLWQYPEGASPFQIGAWVFFGLLDGSLGALPYDSEGYWCGKNTTSFRLATSDAFEYYFRGQKEQFYEGLADSMSYLEPIGYNCYVAFDSNLGVESGFLEFAEIAKNVLNNIGYMYTDVLNVVTQTPETVEEEYPYFVAYNVGDFLIRWFWSSDVSPEIPGSPRKWYN